MLKLNDTRCTSTESASSVYTENPSKTAVLLRQKGASPHRTEDIRSEYYERYDQRPRCRR
jgi:hypothetical protein